MKNQMISQIDRLKSHMHFVFDALCIDYLMSVFFSLRFEVDDRWFVIFDEQNIFYMWCMSHVDDFVFVEFDPHVIEFDRINSD